MLYVTPDTHGRLGLGGPSSSFCSGGRRGGGWAPGEGWELLVGDEPGGGREAGVGAKLPSGSGVSDVKSRAGGNNGGGIAVRVQANKI